MADNLAPTFKIGTGKVVTSLGNGPAPYGFALHIQADGKILAAGNAEDPSGVAFGIVRYNIDGTLDSTFDNDGVVLQRASINGGNIAYGVTTQPDGKILVVGQTSFGLGLIRLKANGSLDTTFSGDGRVTDSFVSVDSSFGYDVALQSDGKIIVVGNTDNQGFFGIARYNSDGTLDTTFPNSGKFLFFYNTIGSNVGRAVDVLPNDMILVSGTTGVGVNSSFILARFNSNGNIDTGFGDGGYITTRIGDGQDIGRSMVVQTDGKILLAGSSQDAAGTNLFTLIRYTSQGILDTTFSSDGKLTTLLDNSNGAFGLALQVDGKILVVGNSAAIGGNSNFSLIRYNADGTLDSSFDGDGIVTTNFISVNAQAYNIAVQADGKIVVSGEVRSLGGGQFTDIALVRYNADGTLDTRFNPTIDTLNNTPNYTENASPIVLDSTVQIYDAELAALNSGNGNYSGSSVSLARQGGANAQDVFSSSGNLIFAGSNAILSGVTIGTLSNANGSLVITFNGNATQARVNEALSAIAYANSSDAPPPSVQINWSFNDGNTGTQGTGGAQSTVGSTTVNITAVNDAPTFNTGNGNGKVITGFVTGLGEGIYSGYSVTTQLDGKILVVGDYYNGSTGNQSDFAVVRYNSDGSIDKSFKSTGLITADFGSTYDACRSVAIQADGKIILAGWVNNGNGNIDFALLRLNVDGSLDTSFSADGKVTTGIGTNSDEARSVVIQADGKILVIGTSWIGTNDNFALIRYNVDGTLDNTFDIDGKVNTDFGSSDLAYSVAIQADGKVLVAGQAYNGSNDDIAVARYNTNGSLDTSFSMDGKLTTITGSGGSKASSIAVQSDGKILVGGSSFTGLNPDFVLVRYNPDGTLDSSFSGDGILTTAIGAGDDLASSLAVQTDGKILVAGYSHNGLNYDFALVRYNIDGTLDTSFSSDGKVTTAVETTDYGHSLTLQPDGKIIVAGTSIGSFAPSNISMVRYNSDGSIDQTFGRSTTLNAITTYIENNTPVALDNTVQIFDAELAAINNYGFASSITLSRQGGANAQDVFSAFGNLSFNGGVVFLSGVQIGSFNTGNGSLNISFIGNVTQANVNEVLSSIAYSNTSDAPPASVIIDWTFSDGNIGAQGVGGTLTATGSSIVNITAVNDAPQLNTPLQDVHFRTGFFDLYSFNQLPFSDPDNSLSELTYSATLSNGSALPSWLNFNPSSFSGRATQPGTFTVRVTARDPLGATTFDDFNLTVDNSPPILLFPVPDHNIASGSNFSYQLSNIFADFANDNLVTNDPITYSATLSNGNALPSWLSFSPATRTFSGVAPQSGTVSLRVVGTDSHNATAFDEFNFNFINFGPVVNSPVPDQNATAGTLLSYALPTNTFTDANGDAITYTATLINGTPLPSWLTFNSATKTFSGTPPLSATGTLSVRLTATDSALASVSDDFNFNIIANNHAPVVNASIPDQNVPSGSLFNSTLPLNTFTDANGDALTFTATLTNGNALPSWLVFNSATKTFTGTPPQSAAGILSIRVTAADQFSLQVFDDFNLNINNNSAPVINSFLGDKNTTSGALFQYTLPADTFTDLDNDYLNYNASLSDGSALPSWLNFNAATKTFSGTPSQLGAFDIRITATDTSFASTSDNFLLNVTASIVPLVLNGRRGKDVLVGNAGNDIISGAAGNDSLYGNDGNDRITGGDGNDFMDGGAGADVMIGGKGSDIYIVDHFGDFISETSKSGGTDSVYSSVSFNLGANLENLVLTGPSNSNGIGNGLKNSIYGNSGSNYIDAGGGVDKLYGGSGDDTYVVDFIRKGSSAAKRYVTLQDSINEGTNEGNDTLIVRGQFVLSKATTLYLDGNLENLDASGTGTTKLNLIGNANSNKLTGNAADNSLDGGSNNDFLKGGLGNDTLTGGVGADTFVWNLSDKGNNANPFIDKVTDFNSFEDKLDLRDLLVGETSSSILNFLDITTSNTSGVINTEIRISNYGGFGFTGGEFNAASENQRITLSGVNLLSGTNEADLLASLITQNKLIIDV